MENKPVEAARRHVWPWFVLGLLLLGMVLVVLWMSVAIRQAEQRRGYVIPSTENTNAVARPPS